MGVLNKDEFFNTINTILGETKTDDSIKQLEDIMDTYQSLEEKSNDNTDWKQKYVENDEAWRKKYKNRFFTGQFNVENNGSLEPNEESDISFEDLFK